MKFSNLDQFFTKKEISNELIDIILKKWPFFKNFSFMEPSAGSGVFIESLIENNIKNKKIEAYDIESKKEKIIQIDYLSLKKRKSKKRVIIGNPPFGKRGKLALKFLNKGLKEANYVCFILPNIFKRYNTQNKINQNARLIYEKKLKNNSFLSSGKDFKINCVFQVWTNLKTKEENLRILERPKIRHNDFITRIHNNTKITLKYFDKKNFNWDLAVHRQGYYDYHQKFINSKKLYKNRQYFFIKIINPIAKKIIKKIDFEKLSKTNTQIYGFSTTDFVKEYELIKNKNE